MTDVLTRRNLLLGGGATVLAALGWRAADRGLFSGVTGPAYSPWDSWQGRPGEGVLRPAHAAILASNAHNTQPWLFGTDDDQIILYADRRRHLGAADPFRREMYLSLGAALANLQVAALRFGYGVTIRLAHGRLEPSAATSPIEVARILLKHGAAEDSTLRDLFEYIPLRHTNRGRYRRHQPVPPAAMQALFGSYGENVRIVPLGEQVLREQVSSMIMAATERFISDPAMVADSGHWMRTGRADILKHRDGVTVDAAGLSPFVTAMAKMLPDQDIATANRYWRDATRDVHIPTAALFGLVLVRDRMDVTQCLAAGKAWQLCHLTATKFGLAAQPLNQPVEMADRNLVLGQQDFYKNALASLTDWKDWDPAFVFRLGFAEKAGVPSPRRPLGDVLRRTSFA